MHLCVDPGCWVGVGHGAAQPHGRDLVGCGCVCVGCGFVGTGWGGWVVWMGSIGSFGLGGCACMTWWPRGGWESHGVNGWGWVVYGGVLALGPV